MAHIHSVYDTDKHFTIDPATRELVNQTPGKARIMQFDHRSERITFDLPKIVEGHDMTTCNRVEVHYINIDAKTKVQNNDIYDVADMQESPEDENIAICSWLIDGNATQLAGPLYFRLRFVCSSQGEVDYAWHTDIYKGLSVSDGILNTNNVVADYSDILAAWDERITELEKRGGGGGTGADGEDGGYYTPNVSQPNSGTMKVSFTPSKADMAKIEDTTINLPSGPKGADGMSPVASVTDIVGGHRITITDKNGTKTVDVMDGKDGQTPKKGTDYWDSEEKAEIVAEVIDSIKIEYPDTHVIHGDVDSNNTITIYGELADGNYVLKYEYADGSTTNVGTIKVGDVSYDNLADPASNDWAVNKRLNSSAELADATGCQTTNFFKCAKGDIIRVKGLDIRYTNSEHTQNARAFFFNATGYSVVGTYPLEDSKVVFDGDDMFTITIDGLTNFSGGKEEDIARGRLSGMLFAGYIADDVIITVNQEITD